MKICPHCGKPLVPIGDGNAYQVTCGKSECQEAEYHANRERNAHRKGRRSK